MLTSLIKQIMIRGQDSSLAPWRNIDAWRSMNLSRTCIYSIHLLYVLRRHWWEAVYPFGGLNPSAAAATVRPAAAASKVP